MRGDLAMRLEQRYRASFARGGAGGGCRPVALHPDSDTQRRGAVGSGDSAQASVLAGPPTTSWSRLSSFAKSYGFTSEGTPESRSNVDVSAANVSPVVNTNRPTIAG